MPRALAASSLDPETWEYSVARTLGVDGGLEVRHADPEAMVRPRRRGLTARVSQLNTVEIVIRLQNSAWRVEIGPRSEPSAENRHGDSRECDRAVTTSIAAPVEAVVAIILQLGSAHLALDCFPEQSLRPLHNNLDLTVTVQTVSGSDGVDLFNAFLLANPANT